MKIIFIGSSSFAVPALEMLASQDRHQLLGVITQPDGRKGRGLKDVAVSPVKEAAAGNNLRIWQPVSVNDPPFIGVLKAKNPDLIIVAAFGQKLGRHILELARHGCINIHPSLLPEYRGAAPVNHALINGDTRTGLSIIRMTEKMDAGPVLKQIEVAIRVDEDAVELKGRLSESSAGLLMEVLGQIERGGPPESVQDESRVTFARKLMKTDGKIEWNKSARVIFNLIRGVQPWPGAYAYLQRAGQKPLRVDILKAGPGGSRPEPDVKMPPGAIVSLSGSGISVACGQGETLSIMTVKPSGGRILSVQEFINGYRLKKGDCFGKEIE